MKTLKTLPTLVIALAATIPSFGFADDSTNTNSTTAPVATTPSTTEIKQAKVDESALSCVMSCPECSIFAKAIHESGLENALAQAKECTIFVPTNKAFEGWDQEELKQLFSCKPALAALVLNHVCSRSLSPEKLKEFKEMALSCNQEDAGSMTSPEKMAKIKDCCEQMRQKMKVKQIVACSDGKPCLGSGTLCNSVTQYPDGIIKCNNGYVYAINKVQIPRGLRVYRELQKKDVDQNSDQTQNQQDNPVLVVEQVEVTAEAVPDNNSDAKNSQTGNSQPTTPDTTPKK